MYGGDELCLTRSSFLEAVLKISQSLVTFRYFHEVTMYRRFMLCNKRVSVKLADNWQPSLVLFLEQRCHEGSFQLLGI